MLLDVRKRTGALWIGLLVLVGIILVGGYRNQEHARRIGDHVAFWRAKQESMHYPQAWYSTSTLPGATRIKEEPGPLHRYSHRVFYMLKTGAQTMRERLPIHSYATLPRWEINAVYGDINDVINGIPVIDIFEYLPEDVLNSDEMTMYHVAKRAKDEKWEVGYTDLDDSKGWDLDKYKNIPMLANAYQMAHPKVEWFIFGDDDTYIHQYGMLEYLRTKFNRWEAVYLGSPAWIDIPRDTNGEHGYRTLAFGHGGSGVALNRKAMQTLFGPDPTASYHIKSVVDKYTRMARSYCCGDAMVAIALYLEGEVELKSPWGLFPKKSDAFQGGNFMDFGIDDGSWCNPLFTWHHLSSSEIEQLLDFEESGPGIDRTIVYDDVYQRFFLPLIVDERQDWDAGEDDMLTFDESAVNIETFEEYNRANGKKELAPHKKKEDCIRVCEINKDCLVWRWTEGKCSIAEKSVRLGKAHNSHSKHYKQPVHSGWNITRIRERRARAKCDPLTYDAKSGHWSDANDPSVQEGWFVRKLIEEQTAQGAKDS